MLEKEVGFKEENIVVLSVDFPLQKVLTLKDQLPQLSVIVLSLVIVELLTVRNQ